MASNADVKTPVISAMERCLAMQAEHLAGLKMGCFSQMNQWLEERQAMVARLRQTLAEVQAGEVDADLRTLLLERLGAILKTEKLLFTIAEQQRTGLQEELTTMRRSKRALHGYGPSLKHRRPQFVSDKG